MRKWWVTVLKQNGNNTVTDYRIMRARNRREAEKNALPSVVISVEPYQGQDLISPALHCLNSREAFI